MLLCIIHIFLDINLSHTLAPKCGSSAHISNSGIDVASNIKEVKQQVVVGETVRTVAETHGSQQITAVTEQMPVIDACVGETQRAVAEAVGQGYQQLTTVSEKTSVTKSKTVEEAKLQAELQAGNGNERNESDAKHTVSGGDEQTSNHVIVVENEIKQVVVQETAVIEILRESVQKSPASPEKTIADDQNSVRKGNEGSETGRMDVDSTVQVPNKSLILSNLDFPCHDEDISGVSQSESSAHTSNCGSDVASNIMEVKQKTVVGETQRAVAEAVAEGYQQLTTVSEKTCVTKNKTVEEATLLAGNGNELNESGAGHTVSGSAEQTSSHVTVVANEIEEIKQVVVQETATTEKLTESAQQSSTSHEKTIIDDQNSLSESNEGSETGNMDVDSTVQVPNKGLIPSNPDFPRYDEDVSGVCQSESSAHISNSGSDVASNIAEVKQQVLVGETERAVAETVGQGYQQLATVSEKMYVNETITLECLPQARNRNRLIVSDAGHAISGSPEQISDHVIFVVNELGEIKQFVVQEMTVTETVTENVQKSSPSQEKTIVDDPERVVTPESAESSQLSEDNCNMNLESTVQPPSKELRPSIENNPNFHLEDERVSGANSNERSSIVQGDDGCAGKMTNKLNPCIQEGEKLILKSEILVLQKLNEVLAKVDEIFEEMQTAATGNGDDEQYKQTLFQQSEEKRKREKKESEVKGGNVELKIGNERSSNNSGVSDASGKRSKAGENFTDGLRAKTPENDGKDATQGDPKGNSSECGHGRITGAAADSKDKTSKPQESRSIQVCFSIARHIKVIKNLRENIARDLIVILYYLR
jgi:hypothetical protein